MTKLTYDVTTDRTTVWIRWTRGELKGLWRALFWIPGRAQMPKT